ncbi:MAG: SDR family NAD(P)-dependent oxidoreductase [Deltaproteobacteria bacterium]|nr:SDR family NAD(P)-dependent oxidoreductase [Deltaproteobacteria bacterium]
MRRFVEKVVVITGSGRGIGRAMASMFAREGARVVVNDVDAGPAEETARAIAEEGGAVVACVADVTQPAEAERLMDEAVRAFGGIDVLVNNAGITRDALIHKMTDAQWDLVVDVNLRAAFNCTRAAARTMAVPNHGGRVIYVSSVSGLMGNPGQINYAAAKAGLVGMTKTVAKEWMRYGINVNCVAYGLVETRLSGEKETAEEVAGEKVGIPKKIRDQFLANMGGALMTPEQGAAPVLFLASDEAYGVTGNVLNVSHGLYI